ncbi:protein kinase [Fodinisporobacter ferrooxydans]|uniref:Protein kinase n=1 Tax=Fodinisporobacter ferrooxydans TaxID=2901836 RepID=A0ABY4CMX9_9BACL|nr:protein kinase [Alicyclobacillaceae bacterium MYW30-H2]
MYSDQALLDIPIGTVLTGKWYRGRYKILRKLGNGANGQVYLAESTGRTYALKLSENAGELALEYQILKDIRGKTVSNTVGPAVFELDDWENSSHTRFFFVMEYVEGCSLAQFVAKKGHKWVAVMISQVLKNVHILHTLGYVFGDLKLDNCLVVEQTATVRMIDFGGVTPFGKGIRQYTEWVDRAWWEQGTRRADQWYDAFAVAMMIVRLLMPEISKKLEADSRNYTGEQLWNSLQEQMKEQCRSKTEIRVWLPILKKAWAGGYTSLLLMREDVLDLMQMQLHVSAMPAADTGFKKTKKRDWTDYWLWVMVAGSLSMFLFFYFYSF